MANCINCSECFEKKNSNKGWNRYSLDREFPAMDTCARAEMERMFAQPLACISNELKGQFLCTQCWHLLGRTAKYRQACKDFTCRTTSESLLLKVLAKKRPRSDSKSSRKTSLKRPRFTSTPLQFKGTITECAGFNAEEAAGVLRKAMKGLGTDEAAIITVMSSHSNEQRQQILTAFKSAYGKDLIHDLKSELAGNFEDVIVGLMYKPIDYDAKILRDAIKGAGTDEMALIEILCSRSNAEITQIKEAYKKWYKSNLESDIKCDTSGHFEKLLVSQLTANRDESTEVNKELATQEAAELFKAGAGKAGTDESAFNRIFSLRSHAQLRATFDAYNQNHKGDIEKAIKSEFSGSIEDGLLAIVKCARSTPAFFAERLYLCMKGAGTKDKVLIRVVVSRAEVDMVQIKQEFERMYKKTLGSFIKGDTGGDYKKILMALCKE